jgi:uncharacterized protein (TIGR02246 family)
MQKMRSLLLLLAISWQAHTQSLASGDSLQILSKINDWDQAWNIKDPILATKWYSEDARFTNAFGDKRNGRKEIEALLTEVFALPFVMAGKSETTEHRYQALHANYVIVHTAVTRKGQQMPDGSVLPDRMTTHMRVFEKEKSGWLIKAHLISDARDKQQVKH